jgi:hypothetical protein
MLFVMLDLNKVDLSHLVEVGRIGSSYIETLPMERHYSRSAICMSDLAEVKLVMLTGLGL